MFRPLERSHILEIVDIMMKEVEARVLEHGLVMQITDATRGYLAEHGFDPKMGARPLRRLIQDEIEDQLSEKLLRGEFGAGDTAELDIEAGAIIVRSPKKKSKSRAKAKAISSDSSDSDTDDKEPVPSS